MLTHQPPSAWAKREKKYHDDKKLWDEKEAEFRKQKGRLVKEIAELKADNRLMKLHDLNAALESDVKALRAQVAQQEAALSALTSEASSAKASLAALEATHVETVRENVRAKKKELE